MDELIFDAKVPLKKKKRLSILDDLDELDGISLLSSKEEPKVEENVETKGPESTEDDGEIDEYMEILKSSVPKVQKGKKFKFNVNYGDKKKKKKKNKDKVISHKKDFELELQLLKNLQSDQDRFVATLQKKYDQMESTKSTARGIGKYTTDLINNITSARSASLQIIDKIISAKKTIADLDFKERKEFGSNSNSEQTNITNYASTYLKQMMDVGRNNIVAGDNNYSIDNLDSEDTDDLFDSISESLGETGRSEEVDLYLKYENQDIEIKVVWDDDCEDEDIRNHYYFIAEKPNGEIVDDYPLPEKTRLSINRSTNIATDQYGNKYKMRIVSESV